VLDNVQKSLLQNTEDNIKPNLSKGGYKSYENLEYNIKMQYPSDWTSKETKGSDVASGGRGL
jgi:hypothetical protein